MALPESGRELYQRNPLAEVTAQLRFPPILRIEAETPAQFQESIRDRYPHYRHVLAAGQLPPDLPAPIRNLIQGMGAAAGPVQHVFESQDRTWSVTLSREFLVLKTSTYRRWEEFRERLESARQAFEQVYRPTTYAQIGLRYVDIVRRSIIGLDNVAWSDLLSPHIAGELSTEEFGENIDSMSRQLHCRFGNNECFLTLKTGIALAEPTTRGGAKEKCFLIDSDFHTHRPTELTNVTAVLDTFNRASGNLFRWAIRPRLREALDPQPL
jgi:uncharacterized protein (TIGR04255 family)